MAAVGPGLPAKELCAATLAGAALSSVTAVAVAAALQLPTPNPTVHNIDQDFSYAT